MGLPAKFIAQCLYTSKDVLRLLGYKKRDFSVAERVFASSLAMLVFPELTNEQRNYVVGIVKSAFK